MLGDEDPTRVQITSAPRFRVLKTSTYLGASTTVLRAGDRLRYTITVKNIGTDNATGVSIRDQIPANTTYVAGSTTLNGTQQNDNAQGVTPLVDGIPVYAPENTTPGVMRADATNTPNNVATITFDVTVYPDLLDGTVISNQALRQRGRLRHRRLSVRRSAHADRERSDARRGRQRAAAVRDEAGGSC